jgi:methylated-DNA-[protein]-cysteine S-methyltransferase
MRFLKLISCFICRMGLVETESYHVAVVSRKGKLIANSVPSRNRGEAQKCLSELLLLWGPDEAVEDAAFQEQIADLLVRLLEDGSESAWTDALEVPLDNLSPVLEELRRTRVGETLTYGALAERAYGSKKSARAVGTAMRTNPFPLIIPCHRVTAASGLGNYSGCGGVSTKRAILALEQKNKRIKL